MHINTGVYTMYNIHIFIYFVCCSHLNQIRFHVFKIAIRYVDCQLLWIFFVNRRATTAAPFLLNKDKRCPELRIVIWKIINSFNRIHEYDVIFFFVWMCCLVRKSPLWNSYKRR